MINMRPVKSKKRRAAPLALDLRRDALGQKPLYDPMQEKERLLKEKAHRRRRSPPRPS